MSSVDGDGNARRRRRGRRREERKSRTDWIEAAFAALAAQGPAGVNVLALARSMDVARGSFYWHFRSREELLREALDLWRRRSTTEYIAKLRALESPRERLERLFSEAFAHEGAGRLFVSIAAASKEPLVVEAFEGAVAERLAFLRENFEALGCSAAEARHRAVLVHEVYLGLWQSTRTLGDGWLRRLGGEGLGAHLVFLCGALIPSGPGEDTA